jgi:hypothetical protein
MSVDVIPESDVTAQALQRLFESAFLDCTIDADGDLRVEDAGIITYVILDPDKKILTLHSQWGLKESASEFSKLQYANRMNDTLVLVRFYIPKPTTLACDLQMVYEGGLLPLQLMKTYRRFINVCQGAARMDTEGIFDTN